MSESRKNLNHTVLNSESMIRKVIRAFTDNWSNNPSAIVRAVLGCWMVSLFRHLRAINHLVQKDELYMVSEVHYRQMFELHLQIRLILSKNQTEMEYFCKKVSAWGCIDYLEKLKPFKDLEFGKIGYQEQLLLLETFGKDLINEIYFERKSHSFYWFGKSFSQLARTVSKSNENLSDAYNLISADAHDLWGVNLGVANPQPNLLDFRGYPDMDTVYIWGADLVDRASQIYLNSWNEIAKVVGARHVDISMKTNILVREKLYK